MTFFVCLETSLYMKSLSNNLIAAFKPKIHIWNWSKNFTFLGCKNRIAIRYG